MFNLFLKWRIQSNIHRLIDYSEWAFHDLRHYPHLDCRHAHYPSICSSDLDKLHFLYERLNIQNRADENIILNILKCHYPFVGYRLQKAWSFFNIIPHHVKNKKKLILEMLEYLRKSIEYKCSGLRSCSITLYNGEQIGEETFRNKRILVYTKYLYDLMLDGLQNDADIITNIIRIFSYYSNDNEIIKIFNNIPNEFKKDKFREILYFPESHSPYQYYEKSEQLIMELFKLLPYENKINLDVLSSLLYQLSPNNFINSILPIIDDINDDSIYKIFKERHFFREEYHYSYSSYEVDYGPFYTGHGNDWSNDIRTETSRTLERVESVFLENNYNQIRNYILSINDGDKLIDKIFGFKK